MVKRIISLAIPAAMIISMAACGQEAKSAADAEGGGKTLRISAIRADNYLESAIEKYKEKHPGVTIDIKEYMASSNKIEEVSEPEGGKGKTMQKRITGDENPRDVEKYINTLNTEIMTGKGPDLISVGELPYRKYADKNLIANLSELIQSDKAFDESQYNTSILDALKYKGSLYAMPLKFSVPMLNGDKTVMDDPSGGIDDSKWTWQDFKSVAEKMLGNNSQGVAALANVSELEFLAYVMGPSYDSFVDMEKKDANFNNQEFTGILNFCKELLDRKLVNTETEELMTGRGNALFFMQEASMPVDYLMLPQLRFNGNGKLYRLPGNGDSDGLSFRTDALYAINSNSSVKSEAWEFMKFLLSEEMQSSMELMGFPVNKAAARAVAEESLELSTARDGKKIMLAGPEGEVQPKPATKEDIEAMEALLAEVKYYDGADREILQIILEEAGPFFKGQKSAEEAAKLMESRVNTYLKE